MNAKLLVRFAVYGAQQQAIDVTQRLQQQIDTAGSHLTINNATMGTDPTPGTPKQFAAIVLADGHEFVFACQEGQTLEFYRPGAPDPGRMIDAAQNAVR